MKKYKIIFLFLVTISNVVAAIPDNFFLNGMPLAIGQDGGLETSQNPAYLGFTRGKSKYSINSQNLVGLPLQLKSNALLNGDLSNGLSYAGSIGFALHDLFTQGLHFGVIVGNNTKDAQENNYISGVETSYNKVGFKGNSSLTNTNVTTNTIAFDTTQYSGKGGLGFAYKLDSENSLGFSLLFANSKQTANSNLNFISDDGAGNLKNISLKSTTTIESNKGTLLLGYVNHTKAGDLGIRINALTFDLQKKTSTTEQTINTNLTNIQQSFDTLLWGAPSFNIGFSQTFFKIIKLYIDGGIKFPLNQTIDNAYKISSSTSNPQRVTEKIKEKMNISLASGIAVAPFKIVTFNLGVNLLQSKAEKEEVTTLGTTSTSKFSNYKKDAWVVMLGATFFNEEPYRLFIGGGISGIFISEPKVVSATDASGSYMKLLSTIITFGGSYSF